MSYVRRQLREDEFRRTCLTEEQKALYVSHAGFHYAVNMLMKQYLDVEERLPKLIAGYAEEALAQRKLFFEEVATARVAPSKILKS